MGLMRRIKNGKSVVPAKIFFFGGIAYGGGEREIYNKILMEVPDIKLFLLMG